MVLVAFSSFFQKSRFSPLTRTVLSEKKETVLALKKHKKKDRVGNGESEPRDHCTPGEVLGATVAPGRDMPRDLEGFRENFSGNDICLETKTSGSKPHKIKTSVKRNWSGGP